MTISNEAKTFKFSRTCSECGETFCTNRPEAEFCSTPCRKAYNNRRAIRGAELYDLIMTMRFDRAHAKDEGLWSQVCALAGAYNTADKHYRGGRKSYDKNAHTRLPLAYDMKGGDNR